MSEAAPGLPDSPAFSTPERARLADGVRALIDAVMTTEINDAAVLLEVADAAEKLAQKLGGGREGVPGYRPRSHGDYLPRSPVVGDASPLSPRIDWDFSDNALDDKPGVEAHGTFGAPYEGPPGHVHGGMIALAFDEVLGIANIAGGHPGMTARLTIHYRKPTPLFHELQFRAAVDRVEGRRIMSRAELWDGETLTAQAEGLFVRPRPERAREIFGPDANTETLEEYTLPDPTRPA